MDEFISKITRNRQLVQRRYGFGLGAAKRAIGCDRPGIGQGTCPRFFVNLDHSIATRAIHCDRLYDTTYQAPAGKGALVCTDLRIPIRAIASHWLKTTLRSVVVAYQCKVIECDRYNLYLFIERWCTRLCCNDQTRNGLTCPACSIAAPLVFDDQTRNGLPCLAHSINAPFVTQGSRLLAQQ